MRSLAPFLWPTLRAGYHPGNIAPVSAPRLARVSASQACTNVPKYRRAAMAASGQARALNNAMEIVDIAFEVMEPRGIEPDHVKPACDDRGMRLALAGVTSVNEV